MTHVLARVKVHTAQEKYYHLNVNVCELDVLVAACMYERVAFAQPDVIVIFSAVQKTHMQISIDCLGT